MLWKFVSANTNMKKLLELIDRKKNTEGEKDTNIHIYVNRLVECLWKKWRDKEARISLNIGLNKVWWLQLDYNLSLKSKMHKNIAVMYTWLAIRCDALSAQSVNIGDMMRLNHDLIKCYTIISSFEYYIVVILSIISFPFVFS